MPQIAVINESTENSANFSDALLAQWVPAFEKQWNGDLRDIWGVDDAHFTIIPKNTAPPAGSWWFVFFDDSDQAGALAYHDLTNDGFPISKVFVKTILGENSSISVGATHEMCEMAVDPWLNSAYQDENGTFWAGEVCDPVEADSYGYEIDGVLVTDFVTPNWFGHQHAQAQIDLRNQATKPFQVLSGGYAQKFDPQAGWQQVTGSRALRTSVMAANPLQPGSRRERRIRQTNQGLEVSERKWGEG